MGDWVELEASDGHRLKAWRAAPKGKPKAALVVIQEIFGVNQHIRSVTERFAVEGYLAIAPSMFDRYQRDVTDEGPVPRAEDPSSVSQPAASIHLLPQGEKGK